MCRSTLQPDAQIEGLKRKPVKGSTSMFFKLSNNSSDFSTDATFPSIADVDASTSESISCESTAAVDCAFAITTHWTWPCKMRPLPNRMKCIWIWKVLLADNRPFQSYWAKKSAYKMYCWKGNKKYILLLADAAEDFFQYEMRYASMA
jgi:hypothetical protein